jgi:4-hydroxythreonine-4-phosphate dehydrogenase
VNDTPSPLALTFGDACGIGPEIIAMAYLRGAADDCVVIGDVDVMRRAARCVDGMLPVARIEAPADLPDVPPRCIPVLQPAGLPAGLAALPFGHVEAMAGLAAARCIEQAVHLARSSEIRAVVTAPIHKEALAAAGIGFPGHTEMLAALCAPPGGPAPAVRMMLANDELRVVLVTIHTSLRRAIEQVTFDAVLQTVRIAHAAARSFVLADAPRIAVAGLNPHAGEGGLFGDEEQTVIAPAIAAARAEGIEASGPYAPDTIFMRARRGEFDLVVAMTHDHGLIPVKYLGVEQGVNVTLGLPIVRTSPDHGTAFDIAGQGKADPASLIAAIAMARRLCHPAAVGHPRGVS